MFDTTTGMDPRLAAAPFDDDSELAYRLSAAHLEDQASAQGAVRRVSSQLASIAPGMLLAAMLATVETRSLPVHDRVTVMKALQRLVSHFQARLYESMAAVADAVIESLGEDAVEDPALAEQAGASEIRAALHLTRRAADSELAVARGLQRRLPDVWQALAVGRLDRRRANLILAQTGHLSTAAAREVARAALERAPELTTGQVTALVKKLCLEADPEDARVRYAAAVEDRRVVVESTVDGTAHVHLYDIAPDVAMGISRRVDQAARHLKTADEARSMDQLRADVVTDLLLSGSGGDTGGGGEVGLVTSLSTLAGLDEESGDLRGFGPVIADVARQVTEQFRNGLWTFVVTDDEGRPVATGTTRRRPTASQRRHVEAAYPTCVFPGCRIPSSQCDFDHTVPWSEGGPTTERNGTPKCRHDHVLRHRGGWTFQPTANGGHAWTSPLGHTYPVHPRGP